MFDIGFQELVIIFIVALLVFGPEKLPEVGRTLGKWMVEIRKGIAGAKLQMDNEFNANEKKTADISSYVPDELKTDTDRPDMNPPKENPEENKDKGNT